MRHPGGRGRRRDPILDMPLNSVPPTLTVEALRSKRSCALHESYVQVGFWGGVDASNLGRLRELWDAGVFGFKCFLSPSGVDEYGSLSYEELERAMREIASFGGLLVCHAEDPDDLMRYDGHVDASYRSFEASRPAECEANAVRKIVRLVARTGCRTHILHVSSGLSVDVLRRAKAEGCRSARRPVRITSRWIATIFPTTPPRSNAVRRFVICMSRTRYGRGLPTARWMVSSPIIPRPARI